MPTAKQFESPQVRLDRLAECAQPWLIGVRHHSAILAARMDSMLDQFQPKRICVELPAEFQSWVSWVAHKEAAAPIALAASARSGELYFYPLADFSPELAAIRWAAKNDVDVQLIDLPLMYRNRAPQNVIDSVSDSDEATNRNPKELEGRKGLPAEIRPEHTPWMDAIYKHLGTDDTESLWERLVESPGMDDSPESVRRAALLFGLIVRDNSRIVSDHDRMREAWMRHSLALGDQTKTVAIIGSFHAAALAPQFIDNEFDRQIKRIFEESSTGADESQPDWTTAMIPYSFSQLDNRSGYPAGVLDPIWHQSIWECKDNSQRQEVLKNVLVEICRDLRKRGVNASTTDAISAYSMTRDLAKLRKLAAAGRSELHEAIISTLVQGEQISRRKTVSSATKRILVGHRLGRLPSDSPRSGLVPHVEDLLAQLRLPGADTTTQKPKRMRLDSLRNPLDRARSVTLQRMSVLGIPYANRIDETQGTRENLTEHWEINWHHATTARLYTLAAHGINLEQAVTATIQRWSQSDEETPEISPEIVLSQLAAAAKCGIGKVVARCAGAVDESFATSASLTQVVAAANWFKRICNGLLPGLPVESELATPPTLMLFDPRPLSDRSHLLAIAIARLDGIMGSDQPADGRAVLELASWIETAEEDWPVGGGLRFRSWMDQTLRDGSPLMQGISLGCQMQLQMVEPKDVEGVTTSWWDQATTPDGRRDFSSKLSGWLIAAGTRVVGDLVWLQGIDQAIQTSKDQAFLHRLLPLHTGFRSLNRRFREQLLEAKLAGIPTESGFRLPIPSDPMTVASNRSKDRLARAAIARVLPQLELRSLDPQSFALTEDSTVVLKTLEQQHELTIGDRWRLILGGRPESQSGIRARGVFADLLGDGEDFDGAGDDLVEPAERSGGKEAPEVDSREWAKKLEKLLGSQVAEEVLLDAAAKGRLAAFQVVNPKRTPPNPDLLRQILSMHSHAEGEMLNRLRAIAKTISDRLAKMLAVRLRSHLTGLMTTRPRNRPSPMLDLPRTLKRNLKHSYVKSNGDRRVIAANPVFRTPATRNMDWSIHLVVDVSGSMETSTVYAALVASVFANLPSVSLQFVAFSTEVADLSEHVDDPLSLLTEVKIGGGTYIGSGLRAARQAIRVPRRSIVVLITDFHEGVSVPELIGEVRTLASSGAKLIGLAALDDGAAAVYHTGIAQQCVAAGMRVAALSPEQLADWVAKQIRGAS